jgi:Ca2+-binding EF-hand superfamily protein
MSRTKASQPPTKPKFDTKPYERPGLTEADILEIKDAFDVFDREHVGLINPKGTISPIQS